ncbi:MAG: hypothetical protein ACJART_002843 [Maribacter sp.]|jgi:hypothetical protein
MLHLLLVQKIVRQIRFIVVLLTLSIFNYTALFSQEQKPFNKEKTKIDTFSQDLNSLDTIEDSKGVLKKTIQVFKFRENKERKKEERVQSFIEELIQNNPAPILNSSNDSILFCRYSNFNPSSNALDSIIQNDTIYYFRKCLQPKIKIIGNYDFYRGGNSQDYNFNYLSGLNYEGYELTPSGDSKTPEILNDFCTSSILNDAKITGCDIYITVQNNNASEISKFLHDSSAQKKFHAQIKNLLPQKKLQGININFQGISTTAREPFVNFISNLYELLSSSESPVEIIITIPSIENKVNIERINAYDFQNLNNLVAYYLVSTENMTLYNDSNTTEAFETIESTINYYLNSKIPAKKLIATVSWSSNDGPNDLVEKYNWILENKLAAIYIRDIDGSSNNLCLWEKVRTELMEIGAILVKKKAIELEKKPSMLFIISIVFLIIGFIFFLWQYFKRR